MEQQSSQILFLYFIYFVYKYFFSKTQMNYEKPIMYKTLDVCLTPRFWKGQLVYDGRKPLTVYRSNIVHTDDVIDQQRPYKPQDTRSLEPDDGLLYQLTKIRNIKGGRGIKMLICITLYNEPIQFLQRTLVGLWKNVRKLVHERGLSSKEIAVIIVQDGIMKLLQNRITRQYSSVVKFFQKMDYDSGKTSCTLIDRIGTILEQVQNYERRELGQFVKKNNDIPPSIPKNVSLLYQVQWRPTRTLDEQFRLNMDYENDPYIQIFGCFKHVNAKKLSSHLWFFQGFCRLLTPQYCTLVDVGTEPQEYGLINFLNALESNPDVGGVSGFMTLDLNVQSTQSMLTSEVVEFEDEKLKYDLEQCCYPIPVLSTIGVVFLAFFDKLFSCFMTILGVFNCFHECFSVQRAQLFQYNYSHMLDKNFESCFGFMNVLPGAWSAYRYRAVSLGNRYEQNLLEKKYLKIVLDPNFTQRDYKQANMYLAQDRILCLGIYCQKGAKYFLKYVPDAIAKTDPMDDLVDLMVQRRRWINSSFFAFDYVFRNYSYDVKQSTHTWKSKSIFMPIIMLLTEASLLNSYLTPALFFFALYTSLFQSYQQIVIPVKNSAGTIQQSAWIIVPAFICFGYITIVTAMIGICINKTAKEGRQLFVIVSGILGLYYLIMIGIVVFYIGYNYFVPSSDNYNDPGTSSTRDLIKYLTIINFISLGGPVVMHIITHPARVIEMLDPRTLISYLYYQAVYSHTLVIYAFCNVDDVTWGTKGIGDTKQGKSYFNDKIQWVSSWIFWNTLLSFFLIFLNQIFQSQEHKSLMLISVGAYSTMIVFVKFLFALIYHVYEYASKSWLKKLYYPEREKEKIEEELCQQNENQEFSRRISQQAPQPQHFAATLNKYKNDNNNNTTNNFTKPPKSGPSTKKSNFELIQQQPEQRQENDNINTDRVFTLRNHSKINEQINDQQESQLSAEPQPIKAMELRPRQLQIRTKIYNN